MLAILASFIWGLTPIFEKIAIQHSRPENPSLIAFSTTFLLSLFLLPVMLLRSRAPFRQIAQHPSGFLLAAVIAGIAPLFGFAAIATAYVGYVAAIFKLSTVFTVLLAYWVLRERPIRERLGGAVLMTAGAILLAL